MTTVKFAIAAVLALSFSGCAHVHSVETSAGPASYLGGQLGAPLAWKTEQTGTCLPLAGDHPQLMERAQAAAPNPKPRAQHETALVLGAGSYVTQGAAVANARDVDCSDPRAAGDARCNVKHLTAQLLAKEGRELACSTVAKF